MRSNHKRIRLKRVELKPIRFEELLARIRQDVHDDVSASPFNHALSNDSDSDDGGIDTYDFN